MANGGEDQQFEQPNLEAFAEAVIDRLVSVENIEKLWKGSEPSAVKVVEIALGAFVAVLGTIGAELAKAIVNAEDIAEPAFQRLARVALKDITGIDADVGQGAGARGSREAAARSIGAGIMQALTGISGGAGGAGGALEPSTAPAEKYLSFVVQMSLEGWLTGLMGEMMTLGQVENLGDLDDALANSLGLARSSRAVMRPFINATVATPATWQINKTYRPTLLSASEAIRQHLRGRWTKEQLDEELARDGYSADRIDALVNGQRKFFSAGDVRTFTDREHWPLDKGIQHLRDQGYDEPAAIDALRLEGLRRIEQLEASEATAILTAYTDRRISAGEMRSMLAAAVSSAEERALLEELADVRRSTNIRHLAPAEARAAVKAGILPVADYRRALEREGYVPEGVFALELLLRHEIDEKRNVEELRREQQAERDAEKAERELAAAARRAEIDAERALRRRGPVSDLERAVIRGIVPFDRLREVLAAEYDADTVEIMAALVESDRERYLEQQTRAEEARKRGERRQIDVGGLERAVMAGLLTPEEFEARLTFLKFDPADAALLAGIVRAKKAEHDEAIARRREAEALAGRRRIDLGRLERLVRRGARSMADYDALLRDLGFEDADRAAMRALLEIQIADDRKADAERAAAEARLNARGLSLDQLRRAVILQIRTIDDYQRFLIDQKFTTDAQAVLLAELRLAVTEADDARRRREQPAPEPAPRGLPLATLQRAARLGVITPDTYIARLAELRYTADDIAIELELLLQEIADTQAARAARAAVPPPPEPRGLTLAQVERAVRSGALTLEDYRAAAIAGGVTGEAADVIVAVLAQEVGTLTEARDVRAIVLRELAAQNVSLEELERAVTKGGQPFGVFFDELARHGIGSDEAELVASLLVDQLEAPAAEG